MISYRLTNASTDILPINLSKKYRIKQLDDIKTTLNTAKSKLDDDFAKKSFAYFWKEFDPFKTEKAIIAKLGNTCNISNAWIKCYEILNYYKILPETLTTLNYVHFDNAAFPGSFLISTHHLVNTTKEWRVAYEWYGSSLLNANEQDSEPLEDKYQLYKNYPDNWLMNENNNGDVLIRDNQLDFQKQVGDRIHLYTSDLGFDVSSDYNNQELLQSHANMGQIISGLLTLRQGGAFITKQYTFFEPITISVMYATASFFDEFYICKPYSSREANSETYLVGKGFRGGASIDHPYIEAMFNRIENKSHMPLFEFNTFDKKYMSTIGKAVREISNRQTNKIEDDIKRVHACQQGRSRETIQVFRQDAEPVLENWYTLNPILPLTESRKLQMFDLYKQQI